MAGFLYGVQSSASMHTIEVCSATAVPQSVACDHRVHGSERDEHPPGTTAAAASLR